MNIDGYMLIKKLYCGEANYANMHIQTTTNTDSPHNILSSLKIDIK